MDDMGSGQSIGTIEAEDTLCPSCCYCLRGLSTIGKCPECGLAYIAVMDKRQAALQAFEQTIPTHWRLWFRPVLLDGFSRWWTRLRLLLCMTIVSALFVFAQIGTTSIGFKFRKINPTVGIRTHNAVANMKHLHYGRRVTLGDGAPIIFALTLFGQMLAAGLISFWYTAASRRVAGDRRLLGRFGLYGATTVPFLCSGPMVVIVIYQLFSAAIPVGSGYTTHLTFPWRPWTPVYLDAVEIFGMSALCLVTCIWTIRFVLRHDLAMRRIRLALGGAMPVP